MMEWRSFTEPFKKTICKIWQDVVKGCVLHALCVRKQNGLKWKILLVFGWVFQDSCLLNRVTWILVVLIVAQKKGIKM